MGRPRRPEGPLQVADRHLPVAAADLEKDGVDVPALDVEPQAVERCPVDGRRL